MSSALLDLVVIGGGINGCGIAADAAGRGLRVLLVERDDLASGTSSASSKLIHGGLRYLEHWEFRLVRAALAEREVLLRAAPHIVRPLRFVLPHTPDQRPRWMLRAGLLLYDALVRRRAIPRSRALDLATDPAGQPLRSDLKRGFAYWDCWVDDARLVVLNARAAADRGAEILTRARMVGAAPAGRAWRVRIIDADGIPHEVDTRTLVNAGGPWVDRVAELIEAPDLPKRKPLRLVKGGHVVVPRIPAAEDAYLLQGADGRIVFALPFEERFTLIGTTDVPFAGDPATVAIDASEEAYLLDLASRYFCTPLQSKDVVWRYAGVRPLYDDDSGDDPSRATRDWHLELTANDTVPPLLTVAGGKVTTYRLLAEEALDRLSPHLPNCGARWTENASLPGGDMPGADFADYFAGLCARRPAFDPDVLRRLARRYGTAADAVLGDAGSAAELGADLGGGLSEREVVYLRDREWARTADDVLWRRTKVGLHLSVIERERAVRAIERVLGS